MATARHASNFTFVHRGPLAVPRARAKEPSCGARVAYGAAGGQRPVPTAGDSHAAPCPGAPPPPGAGPALRACPSLPAATTRTLGPVPTSPCPPASRRALLPPGPHSGAPWERRGAHGVVPALVPAPHPGRDRSRDIRFRTQTDMRNHGRRRGSPGRLACGRSSDLSAGHVGSTFQHVLPKAPAGAEPEGWGGVLPRP